MTPILQAVFDTCHSGTMLDLPHYYCNSVYVPWQSKGDRRTLTMHNQNGLSPFPSFSLFYSSLTLLVISTQ